MSSSTTRARWSLTGAVATLAPRGWTAPAGSLRRTWSSCWVGAELGQVRPRPVSGQPRLEATSSTVEGIFRSPTSSRGAPRDPASPCSSRSWRTLWPCLLDRWVAATMTERDATWLVGPAAAGQHPVDLLDGQQVDPQGPDPGHDGVQVHLVGLFPAGAGDVR